MDAQTLILLLAVCVTLRLSMGTAMTLKTMRSQLDNPPIAFDIGVLLTLGGMFTGTLVLLYAFIQSIA